MFKPIPQAPQYEISADGQVRHIWKSGRVHYLKPFFSVYGYRYVTLPGNIKYLIHRLVAQAFIPNPKNLPFVDHINRKRFDNRVCNLRWVSESDNNRNNEVSRGYAFQKKSTKQLVSGTIKTYLYWCAAWCSQGKKMSKRFKTKEEAEAHLTIIYFLRKCIRKQWRVNLLQSNKPEQGAQPYHLTTRTRSKEWHIANKQKATNYSRKYRWNKSWDGLNKMDVF